MDLTNITYSTESPDASPTTATTTATNVTTTDAEANFTTESYNVTQPLIFLQTAAAQGIAGAFTVVALLITVHQVNSQLLHYEYNCPLGKFTVVALLII